MLPALQAEALAKVATGDQTWLLLEFNCCQLCNLSDSGIETLQTILPFCTEAAAKWPVKVLRFRLLPTLRIPDPSNDIT